MNWDAIGAIGELVGAAVVALTLLYFARQIKGHAVDAQIAAYRSGHNDLAPHINFMYGPQNTSLLCTGFRSFVNLTPEEKMRFDALMVNLINFAELNFYSVRAKVLEEDVLTTWEYFLRHKLFSYQGAREWWEVISQQTAPEARAWFQSQVDNADTTADWYGIYQQG